MANDRRAMDVVFSDKGANPNEWVQIARDFLNLAFAGSHCVVKFPSKKCQNYQFVS
jgi:hypothetical protein